MKALLFLLILVRTAGAQFTISPYSFTPAVPTLASATISGSTLTVTFSAPVTQGAGYSNADLNLDMSVTGDDVPLTYVSGNGTATHVYLSGSPASAGDLVDLDFNGAANSLENGSGTDLAAIVSGAVSNATSASVTMTASFNSNLDWGTSRTFTGTSIGAADASRVVALVINIRSNTAQDAMTATIGGFPATVVLGTEADVSQHFYCAIIYAAVPTGTTANLVLSNLTADSGSNNSMTGSVHRIIGASATAEDSGTVTGSTTLTTTINSSSGGVVIATAMGNAPGPDAVWSLPLTEATDVLTTGGADDTSTTATGPTTGSTVSPQVVLATSTPLYCVMTAVTFQP